MDSDVIDATLRAHTDAFVLRDGDRDRDRGNNTRTRSNSGSIFESRTSSMSSQCAPTMSMSQSYGGQGILLPPSRLQRNQSATIPGISSISYSGYLYKRSNDPHRNVGELQQPQQEQQQQQHQPLHHIDPSAVPELTEMFASCTAASTGSTLGQQLSTSEANSHQYGNHTNISVNPSPANNNLTNERAESFQLATHQQQQQQSTFSPPVIEQKKNVEKNPIQLGLESVAALFGIEFKKSNHDDDGNNNGRSRSSSPAQQGRNSLIERKLAGENLVDDNNRKTQPAVLSTTMHPNKSSSPIKVLSSSDNITGMTTTTTTARRPIPTNNAPSSSPSPLRQDGSHYSLHEALHRRHSTPMMLSGSPSSSELHDSNSFCSKNNTESANVPQNFYDPDDGHLWRAKYCVLEDGVLYFYQHANDGDSVEAAAERKRDNCSMLVDDHNNNNNSYRNSYNECILKDSNMGRSSNNRSSIMSKAGQGQAPTLTASNSSVVSAATQSRRRSSAQDLSKSPMVRPGLHLDSIDMSSSDIGTCVWEKRVFMDCVGGVRTVSKYENSFELLAMDDDDHDQKVIDTLVLKGQNPTEMKEWIFQFHRSLASFMRNIIDVVGSTSSSGAFLDIHHPSSMLSSSHSSRHLSSTSMIGPRSIPQSSSEKHLHRLISTSPSLHQTLSHGHGRTTLKRRMDIKRTTSDSVSLSSTQERETDLHHPFAFREPSPNNMSPPVKSHPPAISKSPFESTATATTTINLLDSGPGNPEMSNKLSINSVIHQPKPSTSGKYIPPHLRSKSKYVPPHVRRQQDQQSQDSNLTNNITPTVRKSSKTNDEAQEGSPSFLTFSLVQIPDQLDIIDPSTTGFVRGGCADPQLIQGSILDKVFIPKKASRLEKTAAEAYGSYGGSFADDTKESKSSLRWEIGAISQCGIRESNEDAYILTNDLLNAFDSGSYGTLPQTAWKEEKTDHSVGLFGIFDGHCGNQGARFAVEQLGRFIHDELRLESNDDSNDSYYNDASSLSPSNIESILREAIVKMDDAFCNICQEDGREWESGSTALVAMVANENLVVASLGDCRGFLCRFVDDAGSYKSDDLWEQLETDMDDLGQYSEERSSESEPLQQCFWREVTTVHSPSAEQESARIEKANGWITTETEIPIGQLRRMDFHDEDVIGILKRCMHYPSGNGNFSTDRERSGKECKAAPQRIIHISRVCGELAVSRALGDRDFKSDFNSLSTQGNNGDGGNTSLWESPLFLPYPDNHDRRFRGDLVINTPDFHRIELGKEGVSNEFLLLACDGLWDVMDADDAVRVVRDLLFRKKVTAKKAAARLAEVAIRLGSSDNITVVLIRLFSRNDIE